MDLRSIINSDSSTAPPPAHPPPSQFHPPQQQPQAPPPADYVRGNQGPYVSPSSASSYQGFQGKPAQPPPLQPLSQTDFRSPSNSSYHSAQSPYQHTPTSSLSGGQQYPFPQPPQHAPPQSPVGQGQYPPSYIPRDSYSSAPISGQSHHYYHPPPSPYTPSGSTPGSAHPPPQHQRSNSSYSTPTPTSAQAPASFARRDSPVLHGSHTFPQPQAQQQHQHSQPSTPLGPPPPHARTPSGSQREQHSPYGHHRNQSGGSYGAPPHNQPGSPTAQLPPGMTRTAGSPTGHTQLGHGSAQSPVSDQDRAGREYIAARERERSVSVSPKTMLPSQSRSDDSDNKYIEHTRFNRQVTPAKRKMEDAMFERNGRAIEQTAHSTSPDAMPLDRRDHGSPLPAGEVSVNGRNGLHPTENHPVPAGSGIGGWRDSGSGPVPEQLRPDTILPTTTAQTTAKEPNQADPRGPHTSSGSPSTMPQTQQTQQPTTPQTAAPRQTPNTQPSPKGHTLPSQASSLPPPPLPNLTSGSAPARDLHTMTAAPGSATSPKQQRKRPRYEEPPIFARKASRSTSSSPVMANRRQPAPVPAPTSGVVAKQDPKRPISSQPAPQPLDSSAVKREPPNGHPHPTSNNVHVPPSLEYGPQGGWEPTITNVIPFEEITRTIGHFLFLQVVQREDVGAGPAGGAPGQGAQLEIEAKIGQLIDRNTNERLRLPVLNECIISKDDPGMRINFKSSMTESQHKTLNQFLNKAVMDSQSTRMDHSHAVQKPRIAMTYVHTRERDSFYELPPHRQNTLPPSIRAQLNPRHRAKVRVTTDQKSGKTLAKIIKARVADLDVYSPRTPFDWRISVNLEMGYDGEIEGLVEGGDNGNRGDRNKDRMSYRHLAYQIDLTQVTPSDSTSKADKEHELEVEVSAAEIRKQGQLARDTGSSAYESLVKGFVDNVRVLVRAAQSP